MSLFEIGSSASSARALVWSGASELSRYSRRRRVLPLAPRVVTEGAATSQKTYFAAAVNPLDQRIVQESLENGAETVFVCSENAKRDLGGSSIDACGQGNELPFHRLVLSRVGRTLDTGDAHTVDDVVRETEGNPLGDFKGPTLHRA